MLLDQTRVEAVMAGRNRRMRRKHNFAGDARNGAVEIQAFLFHAVSNRFEDGKPAVPFVQVQNAGRDAHRFQSAEAADAQQQFLANSKAAIASVEPRSEFAIFGRVSFDIRIEQEQGRSVPLSAATLWRGSSRSASQFAR